MPCSIHHQESIDCLAIDHGQLIHAMGDAVVGRCAGQHRYVEPGGYAHLRLHRGRGSWPAAGPDHSRAPARAPQRGLRSYRGHRHHALWSLLLRVPALHNDGRRLSIAFTVALLTGEDGRTVGVAAVIRNETARFEEEQKLRRRITELEAALKAGGTDKKLWKENRWTRP